jgi:hypothetical protein
VIYLLRYFTNIFIRKVWREDRFPSGPLELFIASAMQLGGDRNYFQIYVVKWQLRLNSSSLLFFLTNNYLC